MSARFAVEGLSEGPREVCSGMLDPYQLHEQLNPSPLLTAQACTEADLEAHGEVATFPVSVLPCHR